MAELSFAEPDEFDVLAVLGAADPGPDPPLLQAARSRAAATTSPAAPLLNHLLRERCIAQAAWFVGLKASGVPDALCAPGYLPNT
jgi:hypothetical protein